MKHKARFSTRSCSGFNIQKNKKFKTWRKVLFSCMFSLRHAGWSDCGSDCLMKCRGISNRSRDETDTSGSSEGSSNMGAAIVSSSSAFFKQSACGTTLEKHQDPNVSVFKRSFPIWEKEKCDLHQSPHRLGSILLLAAYNSAQRGNVLIITLITLRSVLSWKSDFGTWNDVTFKLTVESWRDRDLLLQLTKWLINGAQLSLSRKLRLDGNPEIPTSGELLLLTESALNSEIWRPDAPLAPHGVVSAPTSTVSALTLCPKIWCEARAAFRSGAPLCFDKAC